MPYFIKTGYWEKESKGKNGWLNLNRLFNPDSDPITLTDASVIDLSGANLILSSSASTRTFTISYSEEITIELTLANTAAVYTFPSNSLGVSEGIASGDNTITLAGISGDKYIISIKPLNNTYYIVAKNFGQ